MLCKADFLATNYTNFHKAKHVFIIIKVTLALDKPTSKNSCNSCLKTYSTDLV
jgi:hypothetical protein